MMKTQPWRVRVRLGKLGAGELGGDEAEDMMLVGVRTPTSVYEVVRDVRSNREGDVVRDVVKVKGYSYRSISNDNTLLGGLGRT